MKNSPTKSPVTMGGRASFGGLLLVSLLLGGGNALAQQYSASETAGQKQRQNTAQVDLLATVRDNNSVGNSVGSSTGTASPDSAPTISSIDDAVRAISGTSGNDAASPAATPENAPENAPVTLAVSPAADNATEAATPAATLSASTPSAGASLEKATAPTFGVADIGIDPQMGDESGLTATIWRGTTMARAGMLLDTDVIIGSSPVLSSLAGDVVARRAIRPEGASETDETLMTSRLGWLAAAGRSEDLAAMVDQLPNEAPWLDWKQWLVETQLMSRRDDDACRNVMYQVGRTFESFWHKAKVICTAVHKGDIAGAQFAADILLAMGIDDPVFASLVGKLLNGTDPGPIDPALVDQLHIVLMEAAHHDIGIDGLDALPDSSIQTAVGLRYLDPDARLVTTWRALSRGLIDHERAAKLWRSTNVETDAPRLALARHQSQPSGLPRALVWRALDAEKSARRLPFIAAAMDVDIADGAGLMMAPLYAELAREALAFDGVEARLAGDDGALRTKLAMLVGVGDAADLPAVLAGGEAGAARDLLEMARTGRAEMTSLAMLGKFSLLPLAISAGDMAAMEPGDAMSWLSVAAPGALRAETFLSTSPIMLRALDEAAGAGRVAETILLAHRAVGTTSLAAINPADVAMIAAALDAVGQTEPARRFRRDVVAAHLLSVAQARQIELPPVESAAAAQPPAVDNTAARVSAESDTGEDGAVQGGDQLEGLAPASGGNAAQQADGDSNL
ncbi:MAG: hypothetical protein VXZ67_02990 [Pseudomonadota bacterium]|nr:hypothetical protein [Pseudomonadota bacterium]